MAFSYRTGRRVIRKVLLDADSAAIVVGDALTITNATDGYFKEVDASGEAVSCIATTASASPSSDGDLFVMADFSTESVYEVPPDTGSITQAIAGNTCDCGADARSINIDASSTDDILILEVDVNENIAYVRLLSNSLTGVA